MSRTDATPQLTRNRPVQITRTGQFYDPRYGDFKITESQLDEMIRNFNQRILGVDVFVDVSHHPENGSAGRITRLWRDDDRLMADIEWTPYGLISMEEKGFCYLSMEYDENYQDNETKIRYGCVLKGAGLTIRPVIKRMEKVQLSELDAFRSALAATGCAIPAQTRLVENFIALAEILPTAAARMDMAARIVRLAEALPKAPPKPAPSALTVQQVYGIVEETLRQRTAAACVLDERRRGTIDRFLEDSERWRAPYLMSALEREVRESFKPGMSEADFSHFLNRLDRTRDRMATEHSRRMMLGGRYWERHSAL